MVTPVIYLHLKPNAKLPEFAGPMPSRMVIVAEVEVSQEWQSLVSDWIIQSGCLYMMAWGINCSSWDDSVDIANIKAFEFGEIPEEKFVMTTWHTDAPLKDVFWFAKNNAFHPTVEIERTILLHISVQDREHELLEEYKDIGPEAQMASVK